MIQQAVDHLDGILYVDRMERRSPRPAAPPVPSDLTRPVDPRDPVLRRGPRMLGLHLENLGKVPAESCQASADNVAAPLVLSRQSGVF